MKHVRISAGIILFIIAISTLLSSLIVEGDARNLGFIFTIAFVIAGLVLVKYKPIV